ncbi:MAG: hypothetical protein JW811_06380 [Clostridiales bacterium]|nr:hypothetical protein [Clostridiales bacterium]
MFKKWFGKKTEAAPQSKPSPDKVYFERDNKGTRYENHSAVLAYWMARTNKIQKDPFVMYDFPNEQMAHDALASMPFIHKAQDSRKLICTECFEYGCYAVVEDNVPTGQYEAMVVGKSMTYEEFKQVKEAFEKFGGKRRNDLEPEKTAAKPKTKGNVKPAKFKHKEVKNSAHGTFVYMVYTAPNKASAMAFLENETVSQHHYYIVVETPEGAFGRDIDGIYEE